MNLSHPNARGEYTMTVTNVEGDKVYGHIEKAGFPSGSSGYDIVGTLEGAAHVWHVIHLDGADTQREAAARDKLSTTSVSPLR